MSDVTQSADYTAIQRVGELNAEIKQLQDSNEFLIETNRKALEQREDMFQLVKDKEEEVERLKKELENAEDWIREQG